MGSFFKMNGSHAGPSPSSGPPSMIPQHSSIGDRGFYRKDRDDFWEALSSHYDYLMDDQLVTTCRELEADFSQHSLCPDEGMSSLGSSLPSLPLAGCPPSLSALPPFVQGGSLVGLTPRQLLSRLAELRDWLQEMDTRLEIEDDPDRKKHIIKWSYQELSTYGDCKDRLLREAHMMTSTSALIGGELRAEISAKAEEVSEMWCAKENACSLPQESVDSLDKDKLFHDVTTDMRCLRRWLRDLELRLPAPKTVPPYWTLHDLKTKLENQKSVPNRPSSSSASSTTTTTRTTL
ncbi:uncharacterized protein LOC111265163 isoform X3 [Varroa jacobsoni]|uniref:uncharacterized protein LOC111265163 isoform X3 n=1 Tax=Varroa jacobsoni TaxID=62625 RepID=UPI000BF4EC54|nr:uncharacterized protein LOC111265163 isoform X3 [Varroa jacobsoni]